MNDFEQVLNKIDITNIISKQLHRSAKKIGTWLDFGECPFCGGHDCFRVNSTQRSFYCFQCYTGGDAITFIRLTQKLSTNYDALKILAKQIGHPLTNGKDTQQKSQAEASREKVFSQAVLYYHKQLLTGQKSYDWIQKHRFHTPEVLKQFNVGWSGDQPNGLLNELKKNGVIEKEMLASGLIRRDDEGKFYDLFKTHLYIFPWQFHSVFGHFTIKDPLKKSPDYQLAKEFRHNDLHFYNQSDLFRDRVIIVEGENDLLTVWRSIHAEGSALKSFGVIGTRGQLSEAQLKYLKSVSAGKEFYLAFDNDEAGKRYKEKCIDYLANECEVNLLQWEGAKDIDEYLRDKDNPELLLNQLFKDAFDGIEWKINQLDGCDHPLKVRKIIDPVLETIAKIKDDRLDAYIDFLLEKYAVLKRSNVIKQLKKLGATLDSDRIHNFEIYDSTEQIYISENCYWVPTKDDKRMISNFMFRLVNIYAYEDSQTRERYLKYECIMTNYKGTKSDKIIFDPEERVNVNKFMAKAASLGEFHFWGSTQNLLNVWSYVEHQAEDIKTTHLVQRYGYLENHEIWLFENMAIKNGTIYHEKDGIINIGGRGFKSENVLIYGGDKPILSTEKVDDLFIMDVVYNFWKVCDGHFTQDGDFNSFKGLMLLGFIPALIYRSEIMEKYGLFPILTAYGPSQTGKSVVTQILLNFWGFSNPAEAWEGMTPPGLTQFLSQVNSLPVWLDEFRNNSNRYHKTLMGLLRNAYNGVAPGKGGLSKRLIYQIGGCLWLSGEDTPDDRATISRCAVARFTEINPVRTEAYNWFQINKHKLSAITVKFISEKTKEKAKQFLENIELVSGILLDNGINDERTRINIAIPVAGFFMFDYRNDDNKFQTKFLEYISLQAEEDRQRKAGEDILTKFFEDMARLMDKNNFIPCIRIDDMDNILIFSFNEFYAEYRKELKTEGLNIDDFKKSTIRDYIVKSPFFIKPPERNEFVVKFGDKPKRAFKLDITKMPTHIKEYFDKSIYEQESIF